MTLTIADRKTLEFNNANYAKMTVRGLNDQLSERKVPGRSKATTREAKIELLMSQCWGYQEYKAEKAAATESSQKGWEKYLARQEAPEVTEVPEVTETTKTEEVLTTVDESAASAPLSAWISGKKANPEAIVMVGDESITHDLLTFAGDALKLNRLLHLKLDETWFDDRAIGQVRISKYSVAALSLRLNDSGITLIFPRS